MDDNLEELIEGEGFTEEERKEIREPAPPETEAPPEPAPEPEPESEPATEEEKSPKPELVQRLDREKAKRKAVEKELADMRAKWEQTEKRVSELTAPKPEKPAIPDPDVDPWGHVAARIGTTEKNLETAIAMIEEQRRAADAAHQRESFSRKWNSDLQEFQKKEKPDVMDGIGYLKDVRTRQLSALGLPPAQIVEALENEEAGIVSAAYAAGRNPAELFYELAAITGYRPEPAKKDGADAEDDLKRIGAGQKKAASSVTSGGTDIGGLTLEKILDMPQQDYEDLVLKKFGGSYDKMLARLQQ